MLKKLLFIGLTITALIILYSLSHQVLDSLQGEKRVAEEVSKLNQLKNRNDELQKQLSQVGSVQFIEMQARNKLNMARNGETIVIIPQQEIDKVLGLQKRVQEEIIPNWQGWLRLFTH